MAAFSDFFLVSQAGNSMAFRGDLSADCDPFALTRAECRPSSAIVRWAMGRRRPSDIIRTTFAAPVIVAGRIVEMLVEEGFSGWETYPVQVFDKDGNEISDFHGLAVQGRCGPIADEKSVRVERLLPGGVFPAWRGLYFDLASWDGSDFFMPQGRCGRIIVVDEVRRAFVGGKVKNIVFTSLENVERLKL